MQNYPNPQALFLTFTAPHGKQFHIVLLQPSNPFPTLSPDIVWLFVKHNCVNSHRRWDIRPFLINAFPQGKFGRREGSKHANNPADSNFPLSVTVHFNEVDGLMPHFSNRPLGVHQLSLFCSISARLITSVMVTQSPGPSFFHIIFPSKCLCCKWTFFPSGKQLKYPIETTWSRD